MKISYKGDYSLKVILDLSMHYPHSLVSIQELSTRQDIPKKFLEQILLDLKKGGFLMSKKGPKGGYALAKSPESIILGDVIRFIEGSVYPVSCIDPVHPTECRDKPNCLFSTIWIEVGDAISSIIDNISFKELKDRREAQDKSLFPDYQI